MIELKHIQISFGKNLIQDGKLRIQNSEITLITGESGSGKSSLLYLIGLMTNEQEANYRINDINLDFKDDLLAANYRKKEIGYVFQDNNLNESLTVAQNIRNSANIAGVELNDKNLAKLLDFVELDIDTLHYPASLSGGERQRVAIACALAKNPKIIIADEPTASLDNRNVENIIHIFRKVAREEHKTVIIASHDDRLKAIADTIYSVVDQKIILVKENVEPEKLAINLDEQLRKLPFNYFIKYNRLSKTKYRFRKLAILSLVAFSIAFSSLASSFGSEFAQGQEQFLNDIAKNELFIFNETTPLGIPANDDLQLSLRNEDLDTIAKIEGVSELYPLIEFKSSGAIDGGEVTSGDITVIDKNLQALKIQYGSELPFKNFTILPSFNWQSLEEKCRVIDPGVASGVYLSAEMADRLGINSLDQTQIKLKYLVPSYLYQSTYRVPKEDVEYPTDLDISTSLESQFFVKGILMDSVRNKYSTNGEHVIYLDYNTMKATQAAVIENQEPNAMYEQWRSSAMIIKASDFRMVDSIKTKLIKFDPNFNVLNEYQNVKEMEMNLSKTKSAMQTISYVILGIIFLLMTVIYVQNIFERRYEIAVLKANGLTKRELNRLILVSSVADALTILLITMGLLIFFTTASQGLLGTTIFSLSFEVLLQTVILVLISVLIPTLIVTKRINAFTPSNILRS